MRESTVSLIHADWFEHNGELVIAYQDDASRSILDKILAINTDRGSQFYANKKSKKGKGKSQFQKYLKRTEINSKQQKSSQPGTTTEFMELWT